MPEPQSSGPSGTAPLGQGVLPLPSQGHGSRHYWTKQIDASVEKIKHEKVDWDKNLLSYRAKVLSQAPTTDAIIAPRDFPFVEQKIAQLFFQVPEVHLTALQDELGDAVQIFQSVMNFYLGPDKLNAMAVMNEVAFDALCPSGIMCSKIGFESFEQGASPISTGRMVPADDKNAAALGAGAGAEAFGADSGGGPELGQSRPDLLPGQILGTGAPLPPPAAPAQASLVPQMQVMGNMVYKRYFWERFSPGQALIPVSFHGSVYDKAPWLGYRGADDWAILKKRFKLTGDKPRTKSSMELDELKLKGEKQATSTQVETDKVGFTEIWYRTCLYDDTEVHPEKFRQLVLIDGIQDPVVHRDSPWQYVHPQTGELMGLEGNPIHIGALRYVSDTAYPPSECTIARSTNEELNKSRTQMMLQRDRSIPMRFADVKRVGGETGLEKIRTNIYQGVIPLSNYDPNNPPVGVIALASYPRENFAFNDYLDKDLGQIWAMGANQRGQESETSKTATEIAKIDQWATTRLDKERRMILSYFLGGVRKVAALIQMFAIEPEFVQIVGADKQPRLQKWDRTSIPGKYAFTANPDSAIRVDIAQAKQSILKLYELLGKDPNVRRTELLVEVCRLWNLDPLKIIVQEVPDKGPDPASLSVRLDPVALSIQNPNFPIYLALLEEAGYKSLFTPDQKTGLTPIQAAIQNAQEIAQYQAQTMNFAAGGPAPGAPPRLGAGRPSNGNGTGQPPEHPGAMPHMDHISKHHADQTGDQPGPKPVGTPAGAH